MNSPDEFDRIIKGMTVNSPQEYVDPAPYGTPDAASKPGLTKRGKVALGIGATVIATGTLIGYQSYAAQQAENTAKAQEVALKQQALELEKLKEMNRAAEAARTTNSSQASARQASVNACVKDKEHLVGKGFGSPSYRDLVNTCQDQYAPSSVDVQTAAAGSSTTTSTDTGGDSSGAGLLVGGLALAVFLGAAAKRSTRPTPA